MNAFDTSKSATNNYIDNVLLNLNLNTSISPTDSEPAIFIYQRNVKIIKASILANKNLNSTYIKSLGFDLSSILISCYYNGIQCTESDFTYYYTYEYGNCYVFNAYSSATKLNAIRTGPASGLSLELFTGFSGQQDKFAITRGFYVAVQNNSQLPLTNYEGLRVPVGFISDIGITRTYFYKVIKKYLFLT